MEGVVRDSIFGQLVRLLSRNRYFVYPEENPDFVLPWKSNYAAEKNEETQRQQPNHAISNNFNSGESEPEHNNLRSALTKSTTAQSHASHVTAGRTSTISRHRSREDAIQFTRERFEIEQEGDLERRESLVIVPQRTSDGVILVDWYTTDDPENPQNWGKWKKAYVSFIIGAYTFIVYGASAIYTSAEPFVMEKFGVGTSKAALGLSVYVLGYGTGPMVC